MAEQSMSEAIEQGIEEGGKAVALPEGVAEQPGSAPAQPEAPAQPKPYYEGKKYSFSRTAEGQTGPQEMVDLSSVTVQDLLDGKALVQTKADGKVVHLSLDKAIELAQQTPWLRRVEQELRAEKLQLHQQVRDLGLRGAQADKMEALLADAMEDSTGEKLKTFKEAYLKGVGQPQGQPQGRAEPEPGQMPEAEQRRYQAGADIVQQHIIPFAEDLAKAYGADAKEIAREIVRLSGEEPSLTHEGLTDITNRRIHDLLEAAGYTRAAEVRQFDAEVLRPGRQASGGLTPREQRQAAEAGGEAQAKLAARITELEQQLAQRTVAGAPPTPGGSRGAPAGKVAGMPDPRESSDLVDVGGAGSVAEILDRIRAIK